MKNAVGSIEQVASFRPSKFTQKLSLSPADDRLAAIEGRQFAFNAACAKSNIELFTASSGNDAVMLEEQAMKPCWKLGWVASGKRLVGLVTTKQEDGASRSRNWLYLRDAASAKIIAKAPCERAMRLLASHPCRVFASNNLSFRFGHAYGPA